MHCIYSRPLLFSQKHFFLILTFSKRTLRNTISPRASCSRFKMFAKVVYRQGKLYMYSKTCVKQPLSKDQKMFFNTFYHLMQVESIAECSKGSILQYLRPSLSFQLSLRPLFVYFRVTVLHSFYCMCLYYIFLPPLG